MLTTWCIICHVFVIYLLIHFPPNRKGLPFTALRHSWRVIGYLWSDRFPTALDLGCHCMDPTGYAFLVVSYISCEDDYSAVMTQFEGILACLPSGYCKWSLFMTAEKIKWSLFFCGSLTNVLLSLILFWLGIHTYCLRGISPLHTSCGKACVPTNSVFQPVGPVPVVELVGRLGGTPL
jgi:hypothetical protein